MSELDEFLIAILRLCKEGKKQNPKQALEKIEAIVRPLKQLGKVDR